MVKAEAVNWLEYFTSIKDQCPWSLAAYEQGLLDIRPWTGSALPLEHYHARMYTIEISEQELELLAESLDEGPCEWLWSYPGYGPYATPVPVLIQQDRATLARLRQGIDRASKTKESRD